MSYLAQTYTSSYKASKVTLYKHKVLDRLRNKSDLVITKPDKGNGVVILNRKDYDNMIFDILNDVSKFKKIDHDPTLYREGQLQRFLRKLKNNGLFNETEYKKVYPVGSSFGRIYGLPKTHKLKCPTDKLKLRPIISSIGTYNYGIAKYLTAKLSPYIPSSHSIKDSFTFVQVVSELNTSGKYLVSFDVESLFTNIPLNETINIAVDLILENEPSLKMSRKQLVQLFNFATSKSHFSFKDELFDQIDGVAMGSPLGPVLANVFMGYHERNWISNYNKEKPIYYCRYVDDIFCLFENRPGVLSFLEYINSQHPNIRFTKEEELEGKLPFLDVTVDRCQGVIQPHRYFVNLRLLA